MVNLFQKNMSTEAIETSTQISISRRAAAALTPGVPLTPIVHVDKIGKFRGANFKR